MWILYDLIIHIYGDAISIAALFNPKARKWVKGRKGLLSKIKLAVGQVGVGRLDSWPVGQFKSQSSEVSSQLPANRNIDDLKEKILPTVQLSNCPTVAWFHCASLGEFEQGRPVIEAFREAHPGWKILLTFFSPSGYEVRKNYEGADFIFYLPLDTPWDARKFVRLVRPSIAVFIKYEYWFRYLDVLYNNKIPVYIVSAIFRPDQHFFRWYGGWVRKQLGKVTGFFVQDDQSADLLQSIGIKQVTVSGDTRFDRVAAVAVKAKTFPLVEKFASEMPVFLAGSTWPADEQLIFSLIETYGDRMKFVIAPHEVDDARISAMKSSVVSRQSSVVLFSGLTEENAQDFNILIVDGIGYLSHLYQYASIAYIGGGFGAGIHNILEAAAFGKPVIFGPKYEKFREAVDLIKAGGAFSIINSEQLNNRTIELLDDEAFLKKASGICSDYVHKHTGATKTIISMIGGND